MLGALGVAFVDEKTLISAGSDQTLLQWTFGGAAPRDAEAKLDLVGPAEELAYSPRPHLLVATLGGPIGQPGPTGQIACWKWDRQTRTLAKIEPLLTAPGEGMPDHALFGLAVSPSESLFVAFRNSPAKVYDLPRQLFDLDGSQMEALAFAPDGQTLFGRRVSDKCVSQWRNLRAKPEKTDILSECPATALAATPDKKLVTGGPDGLVQVWDLAKPDPMSAMLGRLGTAVARLTVAPDGKTAAGFDRGSRVAWWDLSTGEKLGGYDSPGPVYGLTFAPDSRHLAVAHGNGAIYMIRLSGSHPKSP